MVPGTGANTLECLFVLKWLLLTSFRVISAAPQSLFPSGRSWGKFQGIVAGGGDGQVLSLEGSTRVSWKPHHKSSCQEEAFSEDCIS